jgi:hypothetical protein
LIKTEPNWKWTPLLTTVICDIFTSKVSTYLWLNF